MQRCFPAYLCWIVTVPGDYAGSAPPRVRPAAVHIVTMCCLWSSPMLCSTSQAGSRAPASARIPCLHCANRRGNGAAWCDLLRIQRPGAFLLFLSCSVHVMCLCGQREVAVLHSLLAGWDVLPSDILLALQKGSKISMHSAEVCKMLCRIHLQRLPAG